MDRMILRQLAALVCVFWLAGAALAQQPMGPLAPGPMGNMPPNFGPPQQQPAPQMNGGWPPQMEYHSTPIKPPQDLRAYRPSIPSGVDIEKFATGPSVNIREYPYLRRSTLAEGYMTPPGMELPESVPGIEATSTWRERLMRTIFPLGDPLTLLPRFPGLGLGR
jgi:hypothetical protein